MNDSLLHLISLLDDGEIHSGAELGEALGISRAAVWKQLQQLQEMGVQVDSVKSKGYRIPGGLHLLSEQDIRRGLSPEVARLLAGIDIFPSLPSTNGHLLAAISQKGGERGRVCLAEQQTAGRGRRGRTWHSPFAKNIYFSLVWRFDQGIAAMEGLSLATGVCICQALESLGIEGVKLKWPNDLLFQGAKLGGVLLEIAGDVSGECYVVLGIGLNVDMSAVATGDIDQAFTDLSSIAAGDQPNRNRVVGALLEQLLPMLAKYHEKGFAVYRSVWEGYNAHYDQWVALVSAQNRVEGKVLGVTDTGALRLACENGERAFVGGEVSLRSAVEAER